MDNETESFFGAWLLFVALVSLSLFDITGLGFLSWSLSEITGFEIFLVLLGEITGLLIFLDAGPGFLKGPEISRMVRSLTDPVFL